jgi:hypothetical protein
LDIPGIENHCKSLSLILSALLRLKSPGTSRIRAHSFSNLRSVANAEMMQDIHRASELEDGAQAYSSLGHTSFA